MNTLLSRITETQNPLVNGVVAIVVTAIFVCVVALVSNLIVNPEMFNSASF